MAYQMWIKSSLQKATARLAVMFSYTDVRCDSAVRGRVFYFRTRVLCPFSDAEQVCTLQRTESFKTSPHSSAQISTRITAADFNARRVHLTNILEKVVKNKIFLRRLLFFSFPVIFPAMLRTHLPYEIA